MCVLCPSGSDTGHSTHTTRSVSPYYTLPCSTEYTIHIWLLHFSASDWSSHRRRKPIRQLNSTIEMKNSYVYIIGDMFAWCPITKLSPRCIVECLPWPEMGSLGLRPRLPISGQGRHSTQLNSLSLVIRRRANMSPIFYTALEVIMPYIMWAV